jgi:hypothetical protein
MLARKFSSFGTVSKPEVCFDVDGKCRGFGYVGLQTSPETLVRPSTHLCSAATSELTLCACLQETCVKAYRNTKWRGKSFRVEVARPDYLLRAEQESNEDEELQNREMLRQTMVCSPCKSRVHHTMMFAYFDLISHRGRRRVRMTSIGRRMSTLSE